MRLFKAVALVILLYMVGVATIALVQMQPVDRNDSATHDITISTSSNRLALSHQLHDAGLIKSDFFFFAYLKITQATILPGTYELSKSMSATSIAERVSLGKFKTTKVTIIEGWRATDIEEYLVKDKNMNQMVGFAAEAAPFEGYLFPDTYELKADITQDQLITLMRDNFAKRTEDLKLAPDLVTFASIVEREAAQDSERAAIAQVYLNRQNIGMKLEADPTIQYAKGNWKAVTLSEYHSVISPYNTYINDGLPPGPICNPGLASLESVVNPDGSKYLYFFHAQGKTYFSTTYEEHRAKVAKYF